MSLNTVCFDIKCKNESFEKAADLLLRFFSVQFHMNNFCTQTGQPLNNQFDDHNCPQRARSTKKVAKIILGVFAAVFALATIGMFFLGGVIQGEIRDSERIEATVAFYREVQRRDSEGNTYRVWYVHVSYYFEDEFFEGRQLRGSDSSRPRVGSTRNVFVHPDRPGEPFRDDRLGIWILTGGFAVATIVSAGLCAYFLVKYKRGDEFDDTPVAM